ncbi:hypothetical protein PC2016_3066 [Pseudoalteromonas carrageenovora]|uniref:DUF2914 domain-containing protein n=1 Tax=Pseudoalteromonas carrageenovora IAM 12662 TaxID=1314868 RepID=A0A2K4XDH0_PSEVC|nr:DUF2914 domain-containing protein [Pseudoalteromonas carrageenovora]MBE0382734.1 hypothetical protein [Pseudoalteromonas carrageenovora IAM 12662]QBJ73251.1 hypothetical protein PC2016_3066 [Pseudoalteromonas carrageenovora]GEB70393.1 hypothetical protein PCA01_11030 [Pseudoalteromonas carrageenovora]SOU42376.1 conserved protein of unknown function [Pseudoalteromonas carrageenovora IAM 12662]
MSQKIVIKANVKREPQNTVPTVSYEWHWRRIVSISMLVAMTSAAVVYGLTASVNAEQGEHANEQEQFLSFDNSPQNSESDDEANINSEAQQSDLLDEPNDITQASIDPLLASQSLQNEAPQLAASEGTDFIDDKNTLAVNNNAQQNASINTALNSELDNEVQQEPENEELQSTVQAASAGDLLVELDSDDGALTGTEGFSADAHVASVALGAQIDTGKISRAVLTRKVSKREPTNVFAADIRLSQFDEGLSFFSELKNLQGQQVKHVWSYEGETMAEITLNVTSPRYRTYSTKNIMDTQTGHWRVDVVDEKSNLIAQKEFRILAD